MRKRRVFIIHLSPYVLKRAQRMLFWFAAENLAFPVNWKDVLEDAVMYHEGIEGMEG